MKLPADVSKEVLAQGKASSSSKGILPPYPDGTKVEFHFKTCTADDEETIDDTRKTGRPMSLIIGKQFKLEIWEMMLNTMIPGQVAKFIVPKQHVQCYPMVSKAVRDSASGEKSHAHHCCGMMQQGIGFEDLDKLIEKPRDLMFIFDLVSVSAPGAYEQESWQLTEDEKLASVPTLQQVGNNLFTEGQYGAAEQKYFEAISRLEQLSLREQPGSSDAKELDDQKCPLLLNYALCLMKRDEYYEAITHLDTALKVHPDNVKGLFRRAKCHQSVGNYHEARDDFKEALRLDPTLKASVAKLVEQMIAEQRRIDELDKTKFQKIFNDDD